MRSFEKLVVRISRLGINDANVIQFLSFQDYVIFIRQMQFGVQITVKILAYFDILF